MAVSFSTAINLMASFNWNGRNNSYVNYYKPIKNLLKDNHMYQYHSQHLKKINLLVQYEKLSSHMEFRFLENGTLDKSVLQKLIILRVKWGYMNTAA
jgi:ADP-dependent phosphofructokinase/glucokinase